MQSFLKFGGQRSIIRGRSEYITVTLSPRRVGDLRHDVFQMISRLVVAVIHRNRIVLVSEVPPVGEKVNWPFLSLPRLLKNALTHGFR